MEVVLSILVGCFLSASIYLFLSRSVIRLLMGVVLLGNGVNLLIFAAGGLTREVPAFIAVGAKSASDLIANPLPQALILTAIVISFSIFAFLLVLVYRAYQEIGSDDTDAMRLAEVIDAPRPPSGY